MSCNLLIVDDSRIIRGAVRKIAHVAGVPDERIHEAANGREALELLEREWIDLILLDINMPVMDGESFMREKSASEAFADITTVVISTESNEHRLDRLRELGVQHVLRKPFEPEDLCRIVRQTVGAVS